MSIFNSLDTNSAQYMTQITNSRQAAPIPPSSMTLRERKKPGLGSDGSVGNTSTSSPHSKRSVSSAKAKGRKSESPQKQPQFIPSSVSEQNAGDPETAGAKKLPRIILRVGPPPNTSAS